MRILSIGSGLGCGGSERALETFSLAYQRLGHSVAVLAWQEGGPRQAPLERAGIEVFVGADDLGRAVAAADAFKPDLVHIHRVGVAWEAEAALLKRLRTRDRRVIETNVFGRVDRSDAGDYIDVHMLLSRWCLWRWRRWIGRVSSGSPIGVVVPNPVAVERFVAIDAGHRRACRDRIGIPEQAFVCGRIGQRSPAKWHPQTFRAFADLAGEDKDAYLVVLGLPASYKPVIEALPPDVRRRVIDLPLIDSDLSLSQLYSSLDCFLHAATLGETFGYVLTEAMLCECPVVTASTPHVDNGQVEVVGHLAGGIVAGSVDALGPALRRMHADVRLRKRLRPRLREHVVGRFEANRVAALAARIGIAALGTGDRAALRRTLAETEGCVTQVDDDEIARLTHDTHGDARVRDLLEMRVRHHPLVQRVIDARLTRHLNHSTASRQQLPVLVTPGARIESAPPRALVETVTGPRSCPHTTPHDTSQPRSTADWRTP
jgi:glycosyltransferase involved in cell wall biosynthesis